jgi:hypothetical protein
MKRRERERMWELYLRVGEMLCLHQHQAWSILQQRSNTLQRLRGRVGSDRWNLWTKSTIVLCPVYWVHCILKWQISLMEEKEWTWVRDRVCTHSLNNEDMQQTTEVEPKYEVHKVPFSKKKQNKETLSPSFFQSQDKISNLFLVVEICIQRF